MNHAKDVVRLSTLSNPPHNPPDRLLNNATPPAGYYPGRAPFDAYGNGGFRFASMSHRGSLLALPSGVWAWEPAGPADITLASFTRVFAEPRGRDFQFLLLGTGARQVFPTAEVRRAFADVGIGLEIMTTGAACRTYNVLLAEGRPVGAALLFVP